MRKIKRWAAYAMLAAILCTFFGCQNKEKELDKKQEAKEEVSFPLPEKITVTAMVRDFNRERTKKIDRILEDRTNIKIDWTIVPAAEYSEVFDLKFHSGELPDVFEMTKEAADRFYEEGDFLDFSEYLGQMPNLCGWIKKIPSIYDDSVDADGHLYCLTTFNTRGQAPKQTIYRKDIFDKEGIKAPETMDELYGALVKLKEKYPDSIPIGNRWGIGNMVNAVCTLYHTKMGFYLDNDTLTYEFGQATKNFHDAIAMLQKFYQAGLLYPEFATVSDKQFVKDITDVKILFLFSEYTCCLHTKAEGDWNGEGAKNQPGFEMTPIPPLSTPYGRGLLDVQSPTSRGHFAVGVNSCSRYIDEIIALLDYQYSDEIIELVNWGIKGESYEIENGKKKWLIGEEERKEWGLDARSGIWPPIDQDCSDTTLDERDIVIVQKANENIEKFAFYEPKYRLVFWGDEKKKAEEINRNLDDICTEELFRFITGELNMEEDWEIFLGELEKAGWKEALELYREAYEALPEDKKGLDMEFGLIKS